jgi:hypothetical protein
MKKTVKSIEKKVMKLHPPQLPPVTILFDREGVLYNREGKQEKRVQGINCIIKGVPGPGKLAYKI